MRVKIIRIDSCKKKNIDDIVTDEIPLTIHVDNNKLSTIICSPDSLKELSVGFLYTSGIIKSIDDIKSITINKNGRDSYISLKRHLKRQKTPLISTSPSNNKKNILKIIFNGSRVASNKITELMEAFQSRSSLFRSTGGVHSAALSTHDKIIIVKEDIGRHNALDKAIGEAVIRKLDTKNLMVFTTGRVSSETILKINKIKSPFLISKSAPTNQAVNISRKINLTLIGFARDSRMNIYSAVERII